MKLKNQFLSLSALLAMGMATTAWAAEAQFVTGEGDVKYVLVPQSGQDELTIPDDVKTFNVYEYGGPNGTFEVGCDGKLLLTAPEGFVLKMNGTITRALPNGSSYGAQPTILVYDGASISNTSALINTYVDGNGGTVTLPSVTSSSQNVLIRFQSRSGSGIQPSDGLAMTVEVVFANAVINQSGATANSYTIPNGKKQFEVQVPAGVGNIDNTTILTAPEGYVLYMPEATTPNGGSMTVEGNLSSTMTVHVTTDDGFASDLNALVHVVKKTTSTTAIDIYTQDDNSYAVAKITDGEYQGAGAVSIPSAVNVDAIVYDRVFTANKAGTIVLPFSLPAGATTNAKFYKLKEVVSVDCKWKATFRNITLDNTNALPTANTPYAVIVPEATELQFNLNGGQASFQTGNIAEQYDNTNKWIFKGTYGYKTWSSTDPEFGLAYALAAADDPNGRYKAGQYGKVGEGTYAVPMRAYMCKVNANVTLGRPLAKGEVSSIESLPESIDVEFIDEEEKTTAIGRMNTVTGAIKIDRWFDLKGRSTNHKPTTKGAFFNKKGIAK